MGAHVVNRLNIPGGQVSLRPEVLRFALELEEQLRGLDDDAAPLTYGQLFAQMGGAVAELIACTPPGIKGWDCLRLIQICGSIGKFALLIAERARHLGTPGPENLNL